MVIATTTAVMMRPTSDAKYSCVGERIRPAIIAPVGNSECVAGQKRMPETIALVITLLIEIGGGLMVLTGYKARYAALVIALWLIPVTLVFHHFWGIPAEQQQDQMVNFLKNVAIMGGLLVLAYANPEKAQARA